jgi:hypothetical protein
MGEVIVVKLWDYVFRCGLLAALIIFFALAGAVGQQSGQEAPISSNDRYGQPQPPASWIPVTDQVSYAMERLERSMASNWVDIEVARERLYTIADTSGSARWQAMAAKERLSSLGSLDASTLARIEEAMERLYSLGDKESSAMWQAEAAAQRLASLTELNSSAAQKVQEARERLYFMEGSNQPRPKDEEAEARLEASAKRMEALKESIGMSLERLRERNIAGS